MFKNKCPFCGTFGKTWSKKPDVFICPNCTTVFSVFGVIAQSESEMGMEDMLNFCN